MKTYYEDDISRIYVTDGPDKEHWGDTIFETKAFGNTKTYKISCNPYESVTMLKDVDNPSNKVALHGMMPPSDKAEKKTWAGFVEALLSGIRKGEKGYKLKSERLNVNVSLNGNYDNLECYKEAVTFISEHLVDIKTFDEKVLAYNMNSRDAQLANIAQLIIGAYNGSYKPPIIRADVPMYVKHTPEGYSLITSERGERVETTDEHINDFVEHVFLVLAGKTDIEWNKVYISEAVKHALKKHFGMEVELSNVGHAHKVDSFGIPEPPIKPTIWVVHDVQVDYYMREILLREGFKCYSNGRETWGLEL